VSLKVFVDTNVFLDSYLERDEGIAKEIEADLIITNNKKDFKFSEIEILSPVEFGLLYVD
jgi:predicted nucleic acid-binding protein